MNVFIVEDEVEWKTYTVETGPFYPNNLLLFRLSKVISLAAKVTNLFVRCHEKDLIWFKKILC